MYGISFLLAVMGLVAWYAKPLDFERPIVIRVVLLRLGRAAAAARLPNQPPAPLIDVGVASADVLPALL
jgi:hypothetical protein